MLTALLALPASAQIVGLVTVEELDAAGVDGSALPAGTVIVDNEAGTLSLAYEDEWRNLGVLYYRDFKIADNAVITLEKNIAGQTNPVFAGYEEGVMSAGAVFELSAKKTGWMTVMLRLNSHKQYVVFEGKTKGIPYTLGMSDGEHAINYSLPVKTTGPDIGGIDFDAENASEYFIKSQRETDGVPLWTDSGGNIVASLEKPSGCEPLMKTTPQFPYIVAGIDDSPDRSYSGFLTFHVTAGNKYYFSALGSKVACGGFVFTEQSAQPTVTFLETESLPELTFTSVMKYKSLSVGDNFKFQDIWYSVLDSDIKTVKTINGADVAENTGDPLSGNVVIPSTVTDGFDNYTVTEIGDYSFSESSIKSISIPNTVTEIGNSAFYGCRSLSSVNIPSGVSKINQATFYACSSLKSIDFPESLQSIGPYAFELCSGLTSLVFPEKFTVLDYYSFSGCEGLTSIVLPPSLTYIGAYTFGGCYNISNVDYTSSNLISTYESAFTDNVYSKATLNAPDITLSTIRTTVPWVKFVHVKAKDGSIGFLGNGDDFQCDGIWYTVLDNENHTCMTKDGGDVTNSDGVLVYNTSGNSLSGDLVIPPTVTYEGQEYKVVRIGVGGFCNLPHLRSVTLPETVTAIGMCAFQRCPELASVKLPESISTIENAVFYGCTSLKSMTLPKQTISVEEHAFSGCTSLKTVELSGNLTSIGSYAFKNCSSLSAMSLPGSLTSIGTYAFDGCSALTSIDIPESITSIVAGMFANCASLTTVNLPSTLTEIGGSAFSECSSLTSIAIPANVISIGGRAFYHDVKLSSINFPMKLTSIGESAFSSCSALTSLDLPESLTSIGIFAFYYCSGLTSVKLPASLTRIGDNAFASCWQIQEISYPSSAPVTASDNVFNERAYKDATLSMPNATLESIQSTTPWNLFGHIMAQNGSIGFVASGDDFEYDGIRYTVIDKDAKTCMTKAGNYDFANDMYLPGNSCTGSVVIPSEVTLYNEKYSVIRVGYAGFAGTDITSVVLPEGMILIDSSAFSRCKSLESAVLPESLETIDSGAFYGCNNLKSVNLPNALRDLGQSSFENCSSLESIVVPETITELNKYVFRECSSLSSVTLPSSLERIGLNAFFFCLGLKSIDLPESLTVIDEAAFYGCKNLESIRIPESVDSVCSAAFKECNNLATVFLPASIKHLGDIAFEFCWLKEFNYYSSSPIGAPDDVFSAYSYLNATLNMPNASLSDIRSTVPWSLFGHIVAADGSIGFVNAGDEFEYEGIMYTVIDPDAKTCKTKDNGNSAAGNLAIPAEASDGYEFYSVIEIGEESFSGSSDLISVSLPASIGKFGKNAFADCKRLSSLVWNGRSALPDSVVEAIANPNLLVYVDSARFAPASLDHNVVVDGVCNSLVLTAGYPFTPVKKFTSLSSRMTKTFSQRTPMDGCSGWETIVLPFDVKEVYSEKLGMALTPFALITDIYSERPYWLYEADRTGEWKHAFGVMAGVPYLISMPNNPEYMDSYNIDGNVTFYNNSATVISPSVTAPYATTWASGRQFRSLWLPLDDSEAVDAMGLNVGIRDLTDDEGQPLAPGSAFHVDVLPRPLEAYVTRMGYEKAMKIIGKDSAVIPIAAESDLNVVADEGLITLVSAKDRVIAIYTPDGITVKTLSLKAGEAYTIDNLTCGIYIVAGRKITVK